MLISLKFEVIPFKKCEWSEWNQCSPLGFSCNNSHQLATELYSWDPPLYSLPSSDKRHLDFINPMIQSTKNIILYRIPLKNKYVYNW